MHAASGPTMLVTGILVAFVFSMQMDLLPHQKQRIVGGLLWLAILFAGMTAIDRSFASERADGCWDNLKLYPVSPTIVYLAKLLANMVALGALQCLLIPLFGLLADLPLLRTCLADTAGRCLGQPGSDIGGYAVECFGNRHRSER